MNSGGNSGIHAPQDAVQVRRSLARAQLSQAGTHFVRALRSGKQALEQRSQIQSGSPHNNGHSAAHGNFAQDPPGEARIVAGGHVLAGTGHIKQVMGDASPLGRRRLCGSTSQ
jgi:hypothetical protein